MNIFRLLGDMSHLLAIFLLLYKMWKTRSVSGISGRSQILFALVFTARYLDLFFSFISLYNTSMKVLYLSATYGTLFLIFFKFRPTYQLSQDTFRIEFIPIPVDRGLALAREIGAVTYVECSARAEPDTVQRVFSEAFRAALNKRKQIEKPCCFL